MESHPTPNKIVEIRRRYGWTQSEAAVLVHVTLRTWQWWESGKRLMPGGLWELFLIKSDIHPDYDRKK